MKKGFKECPFCANEIKEKAIKCQYCGEFLPKEEPKEEPKKKAKKEVKDCPFCMNKIDASATVCPFCDESLEEELIPEKISKKNIKKEVSTDGSTETNELTKANNNIKTAFIFGCIGTGLSLIVALGNENYGQLIGLIYYGVLLYFLYYKKNRMAALFLCIGYTLDTIYAITTGGATGLLGILILAGLFMGTLGAFSYHKIMEETKLTTSETVILVIGGIFTLLEIIGLFAS